MSVFFIIMQTFPLTVKCDYNLRGHTSSRFTACFSFYRHPTWAFGFNRNKVHLIKSKGSSFKYTARVLVNTDIIWDQHACKKKERRRRGRGIKPVCKHFFFFLQVRIYSPKSRRMHLRQRFTYYHVTASTRFTMDVNK